MLCMTGTQLRAERKALGMSVNGLARELGVAPSTISRYENNLIVIRAPRMIILALSSLKNNAQKTRIARAAKRDGK